MTVEEASKLNCPYKPYKTTLDGEPVPTCNPVGCMCWVEVLEKAYTDTLVLKDNEKLDEEKYPNHTRYNINFYGTTYYNHYGRLTTVEQSYCTLRGKDI